MRSVPLDDARARGRVAAVAVDDQDPAEALCLEGVEQFGDHAHVRLDAQRHRAGIRGERRRQPVSERGQHGHSERLGRLERDALGEDVVRLQREIRVLLGRADRQHDTVVALEVALELHPVEVAHAHARGG